MGQRRSSTRGGSGGRASSPRSGTRPTSRVGGRRRGSRTRSGRPRRSSSAAGGGAGGGGGSGGSGALMLGIPAEGGLQFVGRVGTGFTDRALTKLRDTLKPLETD